MSLSGHQSHRMKSDEWLTPPEILSALGRFDLDPCAPVNRPWPMALRHFDIRDDGMAQGWHDRVWLNPPFGNQAEKWLAKLAAHGNGIALIPARTETRMFYEYVWPKADAVLFIKGRPHFHYVDGTRAKFNSGAPICLVAYGYKNVRALQKSALGVTLELSPGFKSWAKCAQWHPRPELSPDLCRT